MTNIIVENLVVRRVIEEIKNNSVEHASRLSRLQCSGCFYICYLIDDEPRSCSRCASSELHAFPRKNNIKPFLKIIDNGATGTRAAVIKQLSTALIALKA
jgi:hypothetical protein